MNKVTTKDLTIHFAPKLVARRVARWLMNNDQPFEYNPQTDGDVKFFVPTAVSDRVHQIILKARREGNPT